MTIDIDDAQTYSQALDMLCTLPLTDTQLLEEDYGPEIDVYASAVATKFGKSTLTVFNDFIDQLQSDRQAVRANDEIVYGNLTQYGETRQEVADDD